MEVLCASLLSWIVNLSDYERPGACPDIRVVEQSWLQERFCYGRPCAITGGFMGGHRVYVADYLDMDRPVHRSYLLHELVHYLQWRTGVMDFDDCEKRMRNEREAYRIQSQYVTQYGARAPRMRPVVCE